MGIYRGVSRLKTSRRIDVLLRYSLCYLRIPAIVNIAVKMVAEVEMSCRLHEVGS